MYSSRGRFCLEVAPTPIPPSGARRDSRAHAHMHSRRRPGLAFCDRARVPPPPPDPGPSLPPGLENRPPLTWVPVPPPPQPPPPRRAPDRLGEGLQRPRPPETTPADPAPLKGPAQPAEAPSPARRIGALKGLRTRPSSGQRGLLPVYHCVHCASSVFHPPSRGLPGSPLARNP